MKGADQDLVARLRRRGLTGTAARALNDRLTKPPRRLGRKGATVAEVLAWVDQVWARGRARAAGGAP